MTTRINLEYLVPVNTESLARVVDIPIVALETRVRIYQIQKPSSVDAFIRELGLEPAMCVLPYEVFHHIHTWKRMKRPGGMTLSAKVINYVSGPKEFDSHWDIMDSNPWKFGSNRRKSIETEYMMEFYDVDLMSEYDVCHFLMIPLAPTSKS